MAENVFANGNAIAGKAGGGQVIAAFPDVCLSPPSPPAGPIPVPYPDTSFSKDTKNGSKTVKINKKEVMLKNKSFYKTSPLGDEAATRSFGASVITHVITGKTYFSAWSMDVKFEGLNVPRHIDITTSNHASYPGSTPPFPNMEDMIQEAKDRIARKECPCCGKKDCPAAFQDGDDPQSMEDFYGLNEENADGTLTQEAKDRMDVYQKLLGIKAKHCTCEGQVFPSPPCDVFRAPDADRTEEIEAKWTQNSDKYYTDFVANNPEVIPNFVASNPGEFAPSGGPRFNKVDHLTPKGAGGCPDNPGNLQPHDTLCKACKLIDDQFGRWQGDNRQWRTQWNEAFRSSGIKRRTIKGFTPSHW